MLSPMSSMTLSPASITSDNPDYRLFSCGLLSPNVVKLEYRLPHKRVVWLVDGLPIIGQACHARAIQRVRSRFPRGLRPRTYKQETRLEKAGLHTGQGRKDLVCSRTKPSLSSTAELSPAFTRIIGSVSGAASRSALADRDLA